MHAVLSPPRKISKATSKKPADGPKPFAHQKRSLEHDESIDIVYDTSDPGTGKTAVAIWAAERRIKRKQVKKVLVLAPKSLLRSVWYNDFKKFAPSLTVAVSTAGKHDKVFAEEADAYVTNIDAVNWLAKQPKGFFAGFDMLIVDECTAYKHHTSQRSKAAAKIAKFFKYRRIMTGTPNGNSITDVWHQVKLLDDGRRLGPSFFAFRETTCTAKQVGPSPHALKWTDKDGAEEAVFGLLSDIVIRHKFEDCVDIPPNHQYTREYELGPKARKAYDQMLQQQLLYIFGEEGLQELAKARVRGTKANVKPRAVVSAIHAGVAMNKLLQIASGAVYEGVDDKYHIIDVGRYELILDLIEQRKHSLTFFYWKHQRDMLVAEADRRGVSFAVIDGSTPDRERQAIVERYQRGVYQTLFAHPRSAAHGLTLTKGTATIWPGPTSDVEMFTQGSKRQHRIGQKQKTETIIVVAKDTREQQVYDNFLAKDARMSNLLDLFSSI